MSSIITSQLSKQVGWEPRTLTYPTMAQVVRADHHQLLVWHRFLPSPCHAEHEKINTEIYNKVFPKGSNHASKS